LRFRGLSPSRFARIRPFLFPPVGRQCRRLPLPSQNFPTLCRTTFPPMLCEPMKASSRSYSQTFSPHSWRPPRRPPSRRCLFGLSISPFKLGPAYVSFFFSFKSPDHELHLFATAHLVGRFRVALVFRTPSRPQPCFKFLCSSGITFTTLRGGLAGSPFLRFFLNFPSQHFVEIFSKPREICRFFPLGDFPRVPLSNFLSRFGPPFRRLKSPPPTFFSRFSQCSWHIFKDGRRFPVLNRPKSRLLELHSLALPWLPLALPVTILFQA